jgi:ABC-type hemin transport system substrate-binding protein
MDFDKEKLITADRLKMPTLTPDLYKSMEQFMPSHINQNLYHNDILKNVTVIQSPTLDGQEKTNELLSQAREEIQKSNEIIKSLSADLESERVANAKANKRADKYKKLFDGAMFVLTIAAIVIAILQLL